MKIGVLTPAFREARFIASNIKQFEDFDFHHLVICTTTPCHGDAKPDDTRCISDTCGAAVIVGDFTSDAEQRNVGIDFLERAGMDWVLVVDADAFWTNENINKLIEDISLHDMRDGLE